MYKQIENRSNGRRKPVEEELRHALGVVESEETSIENRRQRTERRTCPEQMLALNENEYLSSPQ